MIFMVVVIGTTLAFLAIAVIVGQALGSMVLVKTEPVQVDDLPLFECQECGMRWWEFTDPHHTPRCLVGMIK